MKTYPFTRNAEDELIVVPCNLDNDTLTLALDTGASHTVIDLTPLLLAGYEISEAIGIEKIETASGAIEAYLFIIKKIECLGIIKRNFTICAYDFFAYHYMADFEGVVGLDFFRGVKFCIDVDDQEITIQLKNK